MSFLNGFSKVAGAMDEAATIVKSLGKGLKASGGSTVGDALKLKGLGHISDAAKASGGWKNAVTTSAGRAAMGEAVGKAAPSIGALGAYGYAGKKAYNKLTGSSQPQQGYY